LHNEHCWNREIASARRRSRSSFARLLASANLIVGSEVRTPAARSFDVVVMRIVEPYTEAVLPRLLSRVVSAWLWTAILPFGIVQMFLGASGAYLVIYPLYRARHRGLLKFLMGILVLFLHRTDRNAMPARSSDLCRAVQPQPIPCRGSSGILRTDAIS
jgi:hypothetical protein